MGRHIRDNYELIIYRDVTNTPQLSILKQLRWIRIVDVILSIRIIRNNEGLILTYSHYVERVNESMWFRIEL
jgi:hypothetical protein